jgi:hypothetical protein
MVGANLARNLSVCDLRGDRVARTYVEEALGALPRASLVVTADWNLYAPYLYLRYVEGFREDLELGPRGTRELGSPISPKSASNLAYLRSRLRGDPGSESPNLSTESFRYWKVYRVYELAIEASLVHALMTQGPPEMKRRAEAYERWFPGAREIATRSLRKLGRAGPD